jgi:hypothetical protein
MRVDGQEPGTRRERWTSGPLTAKSISIKDKRLKIQLGLDFSSMPTGEARQARREATATPDVLDS